MSALAETLGQEFLASEGDVDVIQSALESIRQHLGMEIAYFSEFVDGRSVFRRVSAPGLEHLIKVGDSNALEDVYCQHILEGRLPELIPDTSDEPIAAVMPITQAVPIGSHVSIPIRLADGEPFGMFCCLSPSPNKSLNLRDLETMRVFANLAARQVNDEITTRRDSRKRKGEIMEVIAQQQFNMVYQPIWTLDRRAPVGFEALCRFSGEPYRSPDIWFNDAATVGLGVDLELTVLERALDGFTALPEHVYISLNASPETVLSGRLLSVLGDVPVERTVIELTEHAQVSDYNDLLDALAPLRAAGMRLAVDDAGAGYASLQHIVQLRPDVIKLDMSLTRAVDIDPARRALAAALIYFAGETGAQIVAEGIETEDEFTALKGLGAQCGQGYLLGKPTPVADCSGFFADGKQPEALVA